MSIGEFASLTRPVLRESLRDEADDFEDELRAELIREGVIEEWS